MTKAALCPPTPAGLALGAMLRLFGQPPDASALEEVFEPDFLASAGSGELTAMLVDVGEATLTSVESVTAHELHARVRAATGERARMRVVVAAEPPHRITGLVVRPEGVRASAGVRLEDLVPPPSTVHTSARPTRADAQSGERGSHLVAQLQGIVTAKQVTGVSLAAVERGRVVLHASSGWADAEHRMPVEARSVFRAYGITKALTAVAVLQLWEEQQFDLDDPVNEHLRSMRVDGPGRAITIRDLLCHRSGLGRVGGRLMWVTQAGRPVDVLGPAIDAPDRPGEVVDSDAGYGVLSQLVEDLTAKPFEERVLENVVAPLGMVSSDLRRSDPPGEQFAVGHDVVFGEAVPAPTEVAALLGSGGLFTTAPDLAAFALAIIGGGANGAGRVLSPEAMSVAVSPVGAGLGVGLGFHLAKLGGERCVWVSGGGPGFSSVLAIVPAKGAAVAVLTNTGGRTGGPGGIEEDAVRMLRDVIAGVG